MQVYHGTSLANALSIQTEGFTPSSRGAFGPGIYLTPSLRYATSYAGPDGAVLTVRVDLYDDAIHTVTNNRDTTSHIENRRYPALFSPCGRILLVKSARFLTVRSVALENTAMAAALGYSILHNSLHRIPGDAARAAQLRSLWGAGEPGAATGRNVRHRVASGSAFDPLVQPRLLAGQAILAKSGAVFTSDWGIHRLGHKRPLYVVSGPTTGGWYTIRAPQSERGAAQEGQHERFLLNEDNILLL